MLDQLLKGALQGLAGSQQGGSHALLQLAAAMLSNDGPSGGIAGLIRQFQRAGLGEQMNSWISTGPNLPVTAQQLAQALGGGQIQQMAQQVGMEPTAFGDQLAQLLPQLVDQLTPDGRAPAGGFGDVLALLSKMTK